MTGPNFTDLLGDDLPDEEAARLRRVHEMLVEAGPPPELPPSLADGPGRKRVAEVKHLPRRRMGAALLVAAAVVAIAFGGGYLLGNRGGSHFATEHTVPMHGTNGTRAEASLQLSDRDRAGNRPIRMVVRGLPDLGAKGYYELYLTRGTTQLASCGTFVVGRRTTVVHLNAPYVLPDGSHPGWVVVAHLRAHPNASPVEMTT